MHIAEVVLSWWELTGGGVAGGTGVAIGLVKMKNEEIPKVAILTSGFFIASLIHIPIGVTSAHLVLNGLTGILLGWLSFPAIFIGLTLQALLFQFGGLTTLGVNTFNMAIPAVISFYLFGWGVKRENRFLSLVCAALAGGSSVLLSAILTALSLSLSGKAFNEIAIALVGAHLPIAIAESIITAVTVGFLRTVKPEIFWIRRTENE